MTLPSIFWLDGALERDLWESYRQHYFERREQGCLTRVVNKSFEMENRIRDLPPPLVEVRGAVCWGKMWSRVGAALDVGSYGAGVSPTRRSAKTRPARKMMGSLPEVTPVNRWWVPVRARLPEWAQGLERRG